jgi:energy-coupling factor transporter transmembrane protein EcfT
MTELSRLISRLQKGINRSASYTKTIRHPHLLVASLQELNDLIGNDKVKDAVATQVSHLIMIKRRALENPSVKEDEVMLNTTLYGPPGVGKTLVGTKLAKVWYSLGYLDSSRNSKERKQDLRDMIKDLFKDGSGGGGSGGADDTTITIYIIFIFIVVLITLLSMAWSFYTKFGGWWTILIVILFLSIILGVAFFISSSMNGSNSSGKNNSEGPKPKDIKGAGCAGPGCPVDRGQGQGAGPAGIQSRNDSNEYGNSPIVINLPADEDVIKVVSRADFVDRYVGWSDKKTIKLLEENLGKVLFVDEAYALVTDVHDTFGMEVLTAINLFISQHPKEIIVIFAGYKDLMENGIFSFQPGLRRRFMWQFDCNGYTEDQMFDIFKMQLQKKGWGLTDEAVTKELFRQNVDVFPAFGGDTDRLTFFAELEHSRDFIKNEKGMAINRLSPDHVRRGIQKLRENNIQSGPETESTNPLANMMKLFRGNTQKRSQQSQQGQRSDATAAQRLTEDDEDQDIIEAVRRTSDSRAYR